MLRYTYLKHSLEASLVIHGREPTLGLPKIRSLILEEFTSLGIPIHAQLETYVKIYSLLKRRMRKPTKSRGLIKRNIHASKRRHLSL